MAVTTTLQIVQSYLGLLIMQYLGKPGASGFINTIVSPAIIPQISVQAITFASAPSAGTFFLSYNGNSTAAINWNDSAATIQTKLQAVASLGAVTVTGSIASLSLVVTFTGINPPALSLIVGNTTLGVAITITETDQTLPLAVMNGFNFVSGTTLASGTQLNIIGEYVGVSRTGFGFQGTAPITLDDADFTSLIQMGIILNQSGSSLSVIQSFLAQFFLGEIYVTDHANMTMTYVIAASVGSQQLIQLFIGENLLPSPMAVQVQVVYVPFAKVFSFRTYTLPNTLGAPFNDYASYQMDWPFLSYANLI